MRKLTLAALATCLPLVAPASNAAVLFSFEEAGGDVVGSFSGALDLTGAEHLFLSFTSGGGAIDPSRAIATAFGSDDVTGLDAYQLSFRPSSFGSGGYTPGDANGSVFGLDNRSGLLFVPFGYAGGALSGSVSFAGATFASLGINPGEYLFSIPNDTITLSFGGEGGGSVNPIPLPAALPLLIGALGLAGVFLRRRVA